MVKASEMVPDFAEPVIGRRYAPTRWLAMTAERPFDRLAAPQKTQVRWHGTCWTATLVAWKSRLEPALPNSPTT